MSGIWISSLIMPTPGFDMKKKFWKSPEKKPWYMFIIDDRIVACLEESASTLKEKKRLESLSGIQVLPASDQALILFNASTFVPYRIQNKMNEYAQSIDLVAGTGCSS